MQPGMRRVVNDSGKSGLLKAWSTLQSYTTTLSRPFIGAESINRAFSKGETIDAIESEKSRILIHELEPNWWILAVRIFRSFHSLIF